MTSFLADRVAQVNRRSAAKQNLLPKSGAGQENRLMTGLRQAYQGAKAGLVDQADLKSRCVFKRCIVYRALRR
jgi:hypothetical protein